MGAKRKAAAGGAVGAVKAAKDNPYVQRLVEDDQLRDDIVQAYESLRVALDRLANGKSPTKAIFDDKKFQKEVRQAAESIRDASVALREPKKKRRSGGGFLRKVLLLAVAAGLALALSEDLRKKVLDALFGAEEEFEYTPTTTPSPATTGTGGGDSGGTSTSPAASA